jgi:hypothetical protein
VELESNGWARLNVADARQKQCGEDLAIGETLPDSNGDLFHEALARRVLEEANQRLDPRIESNNPGIDFHLRGRDWLEASEKCELARTEKNACTGLQKCTAVHCFLRSSSI